MAKTDTLSGYVRVELNFKLDTTISTMVDYPARLVHGTTTNFTDGTGNDQAEGWLTAAVDVTSGGITVSLADSADPCGTGGDDVPENGYDPEGKKIKALFFQNTDADEYVDIGLGTNAPTDFLTGTAPEIRLHPSGKLYWEVPEGTAAINDGSDDEITMTAQTATAPCKISVLYG